MSMTQTVFLRKSEMPTNKQIQESIQSRGYNFEISGNLEKYIDDDGLECIINGHRTYFETYINNPSEITADAAWIAPDLNGQDVTISFVWGADYAAAACIGLISVALIDLSNALIYYMDDEMKYSREMLIADTPVYLKELQK